MKTPVSIGIDLSVVVIAPRGPDAVVLTVRGGSGSPSLPSGPFDPASDRTFEGAVRAFVSAQTGFDLGYVEQLYTFGDAGREAPARDRRVVSVGYLALTTQAVDAAAWPDAVWETWADFFPWEDWRGGRPAVIDEGIAPALELWAAANPARLGRAAELFALAGRRWNEERVLDRYELLYEARLVAEAGRDLALAPGGAGFATGRPMAADHRRILATGLGRLRGKLKYRPVAFELMPERFTLSALQRTIEGIAGLALHKQNFRRGVERTGLVEATGRLETETGGRPAELFRFRREALSGSAVPGLGLPARR